MEGPSHTQMQGGETHQGLRGQPGESWATAPQARLRRDDTGPGQAHLPATDVSQTSTSFCSVPPVWSFHTIRPGSWANQSNQPRSLCAKLACLWIGLVPAFPSTAGCLGTGAFSLGRAVVTATSARLAYGCCQLCLLQATPSPWGHLTRTSSALLLEIAACVYLGKCVL
jgi:hypothetical protein